MPFENPDHDFPQRVRYWLVADGRLRARVDGTVNGKSESEEYVWRRDSLKP